jgi:hypothetical protein
MLFVFNLLLSYRQLQRQEDTRIVDEEELEEFI